MTKETKEPVVKSRRITGKAINCDMFFQIEVDRELPHEELDDHVKSFMLRFQEAASKVLPEMVHLQISMVHLAGGKSAPFDQWPVRQQD